MSELIKTLTALRDKELESAAWHKERRNVETAAKHRAQAAGLTMAIREAEQSL